MSGAEAAAETAAVQAAADRLDRAAIEREACAPVADLIGPSDVDAAYAVQSVLTDRRIERGARIVGKKIGLTSAAVQRQVGVDRPDFGVLFDDMRYGSGDVVPMERLLQPRAEAEIAFVLATDILDPGPAGVREAIGSAIAALEVVDSRIEDWRIGITDTVADNASSGVFVLGDRALPVGRFAPVEVTMRMFRNGEAVSGGTGRDCLGDPLNALEWLARTALDIGAPLRRGDIVLSGALGPMVPVRDGDLIEAEIHPLGRVAATFERFERGD
ncbi:fumarylacetoacetate hydrolase family protein [Actinomadura barringtoniae]|uniref:Fumarylacetoacetate hydrolase family protein n=1 Tax=Actinomadura barringtoniae TaxID=1427535 RepID=A0A939PNI1_9ACTN|nr:fumarylacetoacetate hydrolase family protein [Actinomadura barringtoniae]MBO2453179.1 fumarylacetoacetate hydrolase family protein [Actinomadura barringtoniae]